ncbi:MAG: hypothetical protein IT373_09545 [Polyangiaceae bacterium]|nr:hypothetical protein [Polyangiaceae bacterium]
MTDVPRASWSRRSGSLLLFTFAFAACASSPEAPPPSYPPSYPPGAPPTAPGAPVGAPAVPWLGAAVQAATSFAGMLADLPCPPPGLPPELARLLDCAASRRVATAVAYIPQQINAAALPGAVDFRVLNLVGPVKDQAQVGACAGFALSSLMDNAARRIGRGDVVAPLHVYATYTGRGLESVQDRPMTAEPIWPYDPVRACLLSDPSTASSCGSHYGVVPGSGRADPRLQAELAHADGSGLYRVDRFEELNPPFDMNQVAGLLAGGEALWLSLTFERAAWESDAVDQTGYLPYYPMPGDGIGHAVLLVGYRFGPLGREFLFQNSWGRDWGQQGFAWLPESMLQSHLRYAYRVRVSLAGAPAWPAPPGSPPVTPPGNASWPWPGLPAEWPALPWSGLPQALPLPAGWSLPGLP